MDTILIIEDQPETRLLLCRYLEALGYRCLQAGDAATGLALIASSAPDLVLLDIQLPDRDGLEILSELTPQHPPVIMLTASQRDLEAAFALGARDYLLKPFARGELQARVNNVLSARRAQREREALLEGLQTDLRLAARIQQQWLPQAQDLRLSLASVYDPLETVSGDLLAVCPVDSDQIVFCLGDVSGHGMASALLMSALRSGLEGLIAAGEHEPRLLLKALAQRMQSLLQRHYVTLTLGRLNLATGELLLSHAGHPPVLLLRSGTCHALEGGAMPLGIEPEDGFGIDTQRDWRLLPGDKLLLYSDGLFERRCFGDWQGLAALKAAVLTLTDAHPHRLCQQLPPLLAAAGDDDLSVLALQLNHLGWSRTFAASADAIEAQLGELQAWMKTQGLPTGLQQSAGLIWLEYAYNQLHHGRVSEITLEVRWTGHSLWLCISDAGPAWQLPEPALPAMDADTGRGIWLIRRLSAAFALQRQEQRNVAGIRIDVKAEVTCHV